MEIELPNDFKEFLKLLNSYQVEYLLIGDFAVGYHGYPRATNAMDVWVAVNLANADRLVAALHEFGFAGSGISADLFLEDKKVIRMGHPPMRIEVLTGISGVDFAACYVQRIVGEIDGIPVNIINLGDLKHNKRASGRYKDLDDLEHLP